MQRNIFNKLPEILVSRHEISLAVHFHEHANLALQMNVRGDNAFLRGARRFFCSTGDALGAQDRFGLLEIATTLALEPEMMLLDEPTAGMTHEDVERISALVKRVAADRTVLMVEHNLSVVENLSDHITVLARGEVLAEGDYQTVSRNPDVIQAYMGSGV